MPADPPENNPRGHGPLYAVLFVVVFVVAAISVIWLVTLYANGLVQIVPADFTPVDLASILLTASGLILTGTAAVVAVLALFGYNNIRKAAALSAREVARQEASRVARRAAEDAAQDYFNLVSEAISQGAERVVGVPPISRGYSKEGETEA